MAVEKVVVAVSGIKSANNFIARALEGKYEGEEISTVNIGLDQLLSVKGPEGVVGLVKATRAEFETKKGEHVEQYQLKLAEDLQIVNKVGVPLDLTGNIENAEVEANLIGVTGIDKKYHNRYVRIIGIVLNVNSAAEVPVYKAAQIESSDLFI